MRRAVVFVLLLLLVAGTADATIRILPLGDSMTKGSTQTPQETSHPTYRYWLWQQIKDRDVDFVGSSTAPNFPYDFDQHNEGHGGYTTSAILNGVATDPTHGKLSTWLALYQFDIALVMLGTNDVLNNIPTEESVSNIEEIIRHLRSRNPNAVILIAQIPPTSIPRQNLEYLNEDLPGIAERLSTPRSPIVVVDMYTGYDGVNDNQAPAGIHPAESGEKKIAARWYDALQPYLPAGSTPAVTSPTTIPISLPPMTTAIPTPPAEEMSWWIPYFLISLVAVFTIAGAGVWWAVRTPRGVEGSRSRRTRSGSGSPVSSVTPRTPPAIRIGLDRIRTYDPLGGSVRSLERDLRELEKVEQRRRGVREIDLLAIVPPETIPTMPMPESVRHWAARVGFVPLSLDRSGDVLFYSPVAHQGGTHLVIKRVDDLKDRLGDWSGRK
jgi:lysophospholipase L1-like esterase